MSLVVGRPRTEAPAWTDIRGLSVRHPHAALIASRFKNIEGRSRRLTYRGLVAIHASSSKPTPDAFDLPHIKQLYRLVEGLYPELTVPGAILATARITGCHKADPGGPTCTSTWCRPEAPWHWELTEVAKLPSPIPYLGALTLWRPDPETAARLINHHLSERRAP